MSSTVTVKSFRKRGGEPFPDLWPQRHFSDAVILMSDNLPKGVAQEYSFVAKDDIIGDRVVLIVQPHQSVMFRSDNDAIVRRWLKNHGDVAMRASDAGFGGMIVGRISPLGILHVYYVVSGQYVYLDSGNIQTFMRLREHPTMWAVPVEARTPITFVLDKDGFVGQEPVLLGGRFESLYFPCAPYAESTVYVTDTNTVRFLSFVA